MKHRRLCHLLFAALLALALPAGAAGQEKTAKLTLTVANNSGIPLTRAVLTAVYPPDPSQASGEKQTHELSCAPGAKVTIPRPVSEYVNIELAGADGGFTFADVEVGLEKDDAPVTLTLRKDTVPELRFADPAQNPVAGNNAAWKFTQVLGEFPYGLGVTTREQAVAMGAQQAPEKNELAAITSWQGDKWKVLLAFTGDAPESVLKHICMTVDDPDGGIGGMFVPDALEKHGYGWVYSASKSKPVTDVFGSALFRKIHEAKETNDKSAVRPGDAEALQNDVIILVTINKGQTLLILSKVADLGSLTGK